MFISQRWFTSSWAIGPGKYKRRNEVTDMCSVKLTYNFRSKRRWVDGVSIEAQCTEKSERKEVTRQTWKQKRH